MAAKKTNYLKKLQAGGPGGPKNLGPVYRHENPFEPYAVLSPKEYTRDPYGPVPPYNYNTFYDKAADYVSLETDRAQQRKWAEESKKLGEFMQKIGAINKEVLPEDSPDSAFYDTSNSIRLKEGKYRTGKVPKDLIKEVYNIGREVGVDPYDILAVIGKESTLGNHIWSRDGADGKEKPVSAWKNSYFQDADIMVPAGMVSKEELTRNWTGRDKYASQDPGLFLKFLADKRNPHIETIKGKLGYVYSIKDKEAFYKYIDENPQLLEQYKVYLKDLPKPPKGSYDPIYDIALRVKEGTISDYNPGDKNYTNLLSKEKATLLKEKGITDYIGKLDKENAVQETKIVEAAPIENTPPIKAYGGPIKGEILKIALENPSNTPRSGPKNDIKPIPGEGSKDSDLENIAEIFDLSGLSSWDDVYHEYKKSGMSFNTFVEVLGALPFVGDIAKLSSKGIHLKKYKGLEEALHNLVRGDKRKAINIAANAAAVAGRGSDAIQAYSQFNENNSPSSEVPSKSDKFSPIEKYKEGGRIKNNKTMKVKITGVPKMKKGGAVNKKYEADLKFKEWAKGKGLSLQEAARWVMHNTSDPNMRKTAMDTMTMPDTMAEGGWDSQYNPINPEQTPEYKTYKYTPPTAQDSLDLYNNQLLVNAYYNSRNYTPDPIEQLDPAVAKEQILTDIRLANKYNKDKNSQPIKYPEGNRRFDFNDWYQNIDDNKFKMRENAMGILDTRAPRQLFDWRIMPTLLRTYWNTNESDPLTGDIVGIYAYDPIQVKPYKSLTPEEKKIRDAGGGTYSPPGTYPIPQGIDKKNGNEEAEKKRRIAEAEKKRRIAEAEKKRRIAEAEKKRKMAEAEKKKKEQMGDSKEGNSAGESPIVSPPADSISGPTIPAQEAPIGATPNNPTPPGSGGQGPTNKKVTYWEKGKKIYETRDTKNLPKRWKDIPKAKYGGRISGPIKYMPTGGSVEDYLQSKGYADGIPSYVNNAYDARQYLKKAQKAEKNKNAKIFPEMNRPLDMSMLYKNPGGGGDGTSTGNIDNRYPIQSLDWSVIPHAFLQYQNLGYNEPLPEEGIGRFIYPASSPAPPIKAQNTAPDQQPNQDIAEHKYGGGIKINKKNKGNFTAYAKRKGMGVQEAAHWVMANSKDPKLRKQANFALNAAGWHHPNHMGSGGYIPYYMEEGGNPTDPNKGTPPPPGQGTEVAKEAAKDPEYSVTLPPAEVTAKKWGWKDKARRALKHIFVPGSTDNKPLEFAKDMALGSIGEMNVPRMSFLPKLFGHGNLGYTRSGIYNYFNKNKNIAKAAEYWGKDFKPGWSKLNDVYDISDHGFDFEGRKIVMVKNRKTGDVIPMYKRTGGGTLAGEVDPTGAQAGDWVPFHGTAVVKGPEYGNPSDWDWMVKPREGRKGNNAMYQDAANSLKNSFFNKMEDWPSTQVFGPKQQQAINAMFRAYGYNVNSAINKNAGEAIRKIYAYGGYIPHALQFMGDGGPILEEVLMMAEGGIPERYRNMGFTHVGQKKKGDGKHKWKVLAKKGDKYKVVQGGYRGMDDYTQHHNEQRRQRFWQRMGGKNSAKANDPFSPLYWHKKLGTWAEGGMITNEYPEMYDYNPIMAMGGYSGDASGRKTIPMDPREFLNAMSNNDMSVLNKLNYHLSPNTPVVDVGSYLDMLTSPMMGYPPTMADGGRTQTPIIDPKYTRQNAVRDSAIVSEIGKMRANALAGAKNRFLQNYSGTGGAKWKMPINDALALLGQFDKNNPELAKAFKTSFDNLSGYNKDTPKSEDIKQEILNYKADTGAGHRSWIYSEPILYAQGKDKEYPVYAQRYTAPYSKLTPEMQKEVAAATTRAAKGGTPKKRTPEVAPPSDITQTAGPTQAAQAAPSAYKRQVVSANDAFVSDLRDSGDFIGSSVKAAADAARNAVFNTTARNEKQLSDGKYEYKIENPLDLENSKIQSRRLGTKDWVTWNDKNMPPEKKKVAIKNLRNQFPDAFVKDPAYMRDDVSTTRPAEGSTNQATSQGGSTGGSSGSGVKSAGIASPTVNDTNKGIARPNISSGSENQGSASDPYSDLLAELEKEIIDMYSQNEALAAKDKQSIQDLFAGRRRAAVGSALLEGLTGLQSTVYEPQKLNISLVPGKYQRMPISALEQQASNLRGQVSSLGRELVQSGILPSQIMSLLSNAQGRTSDTESQLRFNFYNTNLALDRQKYGELKSIRDTNEANRIAAEASARTDQNQLLRNQIDILTNLNNVRDKLKADEFNYLRQSQQDYFKNKRNALQDKFGIAALRIRGEEAKKAADAAIKALQSSIDAWKTGNPVGVPAGNIQTGEIILDEDITPTPNSAGAPYR